MIDTLITLTNGEYVGNIEQLKEFVVDGNYTPFQELVDSCDSFYYDGNELLIYKEGKIIYSGIIKEYCKQRFVTEMYGEFDLVYENKLDYNSDYMECLSELYRLRGWYPKKWIGMLDKVYTEYGVDVVNKVRSECGYEEDTPRNKKKIDDYYLHKIRVKQGIVNHLCKKHKISDKVRNELNDQILICEGLNTPITVELIQELVYLPFNRMMNKVSKHKYA